MTIPRIHEQGRDGRWGTPEGYSVHPASLHMASVAMNLEKRVQEGLPDATHAAAATWDVWRPTNGPAVPPVVRVGRTALPDTDGTPLVIMPMPGAKHIALSRKNESADILVPALLRAVGSYPPGSVKFWVVDYLRGELNGLNGLGADMVEYINHDEVTEKFGQLAKLQELLITGRASEAGTLAAQRHILVINGNIRLDRNARRHLDYLAVSGNRWGGIVSVDTELPKSEFVQRFFPGKVGCILDPRPPAGLMEAAVKQVSSELQQEQDTPFTILDIDEGPVWGSSIADGIKVVLGKEVISGELPLVNMENIPHFLVGGPTRRGKSVHLQGLVASIVRKYKPEDVEIVFMDGAGTASAMWGSTGPGDPELPHASILAGNLSTDPEFGMEVLLHLQASIRERISLTSGRGEKFIDLKRAYPHMKETVVVWDEFDELLKDPQYGKRAAELLIYILQKGAKAGVHFIGATQHVGSISSLYGSTKAATNQFGLRVAFSGAEDVMDPVDNPGNFANQISNFRRRRAWINNNYGRGPAEHNLVVRVPNATFEFVREFKRRLPQPRAGHKRAVVYDGRELPTLEGLEDYGKLTPDSGRAKKVFVGQEITIEGKAATVEFSEDYGSNLLILGTKTQEIADIFSSAALSLAKQHSPGTATFSIVCCDSRQRDDAGALANRLMSAKHEVTFVPDSEQAEKFWQEVAEGTDSAASQKHYVLIYGADRLKNKIVARILKRVVTVGPEQGIHTIMSAGSLSAAQAHAIDADPRELFEARLVLDGTQRDIGRLVDYGYSWNSSDRPGRAILAKDRGDPGVIRLFAR